MYHAPLALLLAACLALASCKRHKPARIAPDGERAAAIQLTAATQPATQPAARPADATLTEGQLLQFIAVSRKIVASLPPANRGVARSPDGFASLVVAVKDDETLKPHFNPAKMSLEDWSAIGTHAWAAWSVAQVDYNAEAPLRENAAREAEARMKLASAEATVKAGLRVLLPEERARFASAAHDAAVDANDRAETWAEKSAHLREQIAMAGDEPEISPGASPAMLDARSRALGASRAARAAMVQELAAALRNERQAREDARRAEATAQHPETPLDDTEKSELLRQSREAIEQAKTQLAQIHDEAATTKIRLSEDRRVNADARRKTASEWDIALVRKHLGEFNDAWGMTVEGRLK